MLIEERARREQIRLFLADVCRAAAPMGGRAVGGAGRRRAVMNFVN